jgi:DNA replication protein DnaC
MLKMNGVNDIKVTQDNFLFLMPQLSSEQVLLFLNGMVFPVPAMPGLIDVCGEASMSVIYQRMTEEIPNLTITDEIFAMLMQGDFITDEDWQRTMLQSARGFVMQTAARCFFVGGHTGTGKTHISTKICKAYIERGHALLYRKWTEVMRELLDYSNEGRGQMFKELTEIEILYLDDLFKPIGNRIDAKEVRATFEIIDRRYISPNKITIISSELTLPKIKNIDEATARRIEEMAGGKDGFVTNIGDDKIFSKVDWRHR